MEGATETLSSPLVAPLGMVAVMEVAAQEVIVNGNPFKYAALAPCVLPKPLPVIVMGEPDDPVLAEICDITGDVTTDEEKETLSNVAVARLLAQSLETASPM